MGSRDWFHSLKSTNMQEINKALDYSEGLWKHQSNQRTFYIADSYPIVKLSLE